MTPLIDLLKKDKKWHGLEKFQEAFDKLKSAVVSELVLRLLDFELPFKVHTNAFNKVIGGVLFGRIT